MTDDEVKRASPGTGSDRAARLGEALRSNLSRRKEQARARRATLMADDDASDTEDTKGDQAPE